MMQQAANNRIGTIVIDLDDLEACLGGNEHTWEPSLGEEKLHSI